MCRESAPALECVCFFSNRSVKMVVWSIRCSRPLEVTTRDLMQSSISEQSLKHVEGVVGSIRSNRKLQELFRSIVANYKRQKNERSIGSFLEMVGALEFAERRGSSVLPFMKKAYAENSGSARHALQYLRRWCHVALSERLYETATMWFLMRVALMDTYTLMHIYNHHVYDFCIFYGGEKHAETLRRNLDESHARRVPMPSYLCDCVQEYKLMTEVAYQLSSKIIIILGENHLHTDVKFAPWLLSILKAKCNVRERVLFLVEKHIYAGRDDLQQELTCNMPHMAIHRLRCDNFMTTHACANLRIVSVDNRHSDLGFLRSEMMRLWYDCETFRTNAIAFQRGALEDMLNELGKFT